MNYYSLNRRSENVDFKEATILGQAPDKGLFFPEHIPFFDSSFFGKIENMEDEEIAYQVMRPYAGESIPEAALRAIIHDTLNFPIPLVQLNDTIFSLELIHGPTLAFKDVGARFMSRCLGYFMEQAAASGQTVVLVATSGDTGGAVASGFYNVKGVQVVILYPSGKVSRVQEKQLTTHGKNIHAIEVNGSFDDCQQLVKQAFADEDISHRMFLTSANSINVARWLPQQIYYFLAYKQWPYKKHPPVVSVPSGNFGNLCAGILAHASGLPVQHFIAACNINDVVPEFLKTGNYQAKETRATISNAMDVGDPSNFIRIMEIFDNDITGMKRILSAFVVNDNETRDTIQRVFERYHYLLDPHGAIGYLSLEKYLNDHEGLKGFFVETAHPVKFFDVVEPVIKEQIALPAGVAAIMGKIKQATRMDVHFPDLKRYLLQL